MTLFKSKLAFYWPPTGEFCPHAQQWFPTHAQQSTQNAQQKCSTVENAEQICSTPMNAQQHNVQQQSMLNTDNME